MENLNQFLDLSEQELLALYKTLTHLSTVRRDCTIERDDGIDLDAWLVLKLRQWYARLLLTGQLEWLPVEDVKQDVSLSADAYGVVTATIPPQCVRPVEWRLHGWDTSVTSFLRPDDARLRLQGNPWTRGVKCAPAAADMGDHLLLYSLPPGVSPMLVTARCVTRPANGNYRLHRAALSTLPEIDSTP